MCSRKDQTRTQLMALNGPSPQLELQMALTSKEHKNNANIELKKRTKPKQQIKHKRPCQVQRPAHSPFYESKLPVIFQQIFVNIYLKISETNIYIYNIVKI